MKIKSRLLWSLLGMSLLVGLVGALAVNRQHAAALVGATKEAEDVARVVSFLLMPDLKLAPFAQQIVARLHETQGRDVVVMNAKRMVLADADPEEIGKPYTQDPAGEVAATIKDRRVRTFIESGENHPGGIRQIVVPVENASRQAMGAVVMEYSPLYEELVALTETTSRQVALAGLGSILAALLIAVYLGRSIANPLGQLTKVATGLAAGRTDLPMPPPRGDEIGQLAEAFTNMVHKRREAEESLREARDHLERRVQDRTMELEAIHKQLVEASRRGGMAEIATNVLHNVGNVLNSINISTSLIGERVKHSKAASLARVVTLLNEKKDDLGTFMTADPRGQHVPTLLAQLSEQFTADREGIASEMDSLRENVEHIKEIVAMQQSYAKFGGAREVIDVLHLVEDSLRMNEGALNRHQVRLAREFAAVPPMNLEKHKVLQILVNLVRNAKYACDESNRTDRVLTMRVTAGEGRVRIAVIDNGVGIAPENMTRIFNHGFTTRESGHGFGLHSGALAAKEMGGSLTAQSEGLGHGATFTLELPEALTEHP